MSYLSDTTKARMTTVQFHTARFLLSFHYPSYLFLEIRICCNSIQKMKRDLIISAWMLSSNLTSDVAGQAFDVEKQLINLAGRQY